MDAKNCDQESACRGIVRTENLKFMKMYKLLIRFLSISVHKIPSLIRFRRARTGCAAFMLSAITVARPTRVCPSISPVSGFKRKCAAQSSIRGLKSRTSVPVNGPTPFWRVALWALQCEQASAKLLCSVRPPAAFGTMCSTSKKEGENCSGYWQYSHCFICPICHRTTQ